VSKLWLTLTTCPSVSSLYRLCIAYRNIVTDTFKATPAVRLEVTGSRGIQKMKIMQESGCVIIGYYTNAAIRF